MGITDGSGKLLGTNLHWADILIIILYFVIVMAFGLWSSFRNRGSVGGYFLAGRSMHWIPVGASLFASNIGSGHFIGLAGSGAATGIGIACFELNALFVLLILGWVFVPVYIAAGVFTMPEYIRKRFGGQRIRIYLSVLALLLSIFTKVAADLFAGATFIEQALRWNLYLAIVILLAIAALFTIAGGLTAVIWTDFIQTVIMLIGAAVLMVIGFIQVGGYTEMIDKFLHAFPNTTKSRIGQHDSGELYNTDSSYNYTMCGVPTKYSTHLFRPADDPALPWPGITFGLTISAVWYWCSDQVGGFEMTRYKYMQAVPNTTLYAENRTECGRPPANAMHFFRSIDDPVYPWTGALFGVTISSVWYWCSDQVIVQRALAAKDLSHAKAGTILAGYLKILPMWLLVLPGMMARILFPNEVGCADPDECESICGSRAGCTNIAYPMLVIKLMPDGARGLMLAVMMAALMSSLTSIFNSSSTIFTMDIWRRIRKNASDVELMIVGRVFVLFMVAIGILWIPIVQNFSELFHYIQSITSFLAPPICAVYVVAVLWKRANEQGAFWSLMIGLVVGLIRFIWEFSYPSVPCGEEYLDNKPAIIGKVHYLHFGIILFGITVIACVIISLLTEPIDEKYLPRLTFWDRYSTEPRVDIDREEEEARAKKSMGVDNLGMTNSADVTMTTESSSNPNISEPQPKNDIPIWKKALQWICGIEKHEEPELTAAQRQEMEDKQTSLYEKPKWRRLCNINAILLMVVAIFFWGFFY